jgi:hypothetical protein
MEIAIAVIVIIIVCITSLIKRIYKGIHYALHSKERAQNRQHLSAQTSQAYTAWQAAMQKENQAKQKLENAIAEKYGSQAVDKVFNRTIWMGMPNFMLIVALGYPQEKKQEITKKSIKEKWYYNPRINRMHNIVYQLVITIEYDHVTGWKDM